MINFFLTKNKFLFYSERPVFITHSSPSNMNTLNRSRNEVLWYLSVLLVIFTVNARGWENGHVYATTINIHNLLTKHRNSVNFRERQDRRNVPNLHKNRFQIRISLLAYWEDEVSWDHIGLHLEAPDFHFIVFFALGILEVNLEIKRE